MPEYTRPATWEDVKILARLLNEAGVQYALVGGYAIAAHGFNRFSEDIDILVNPDAENSRRWVLALSELPDHATRELVADSDVFANVGHRRSRGVAPRMRLHPGRPLSGVLNVYQQVCRIAQRNHCCHYASHNGITDAILR